MAGQPARLSWPSVQPGALHREVDRWHVQMRRGCRMSHSRPTSRAQACGLVTHTAALVATARGITSATTSDTDSDIDMDERLLRTSHVVTLDVAHDVVTVTRRGHAVAGRLTRRSRCVVIATASAESPTMAECWQQPVTVRKMATESAQTVGYDVFISYSHAADGRLAPALQHGLQHLAKPRFTRSALRVFRDDTGLAVSPALWGSIERALDRSRYFLLLASPDAAASAWVDREVRRWTAAKAASAILLVVTAGDWAWDESRGDFNWEISSAIPRALKGVFREEPRALDLRWAHHEAQLDLRHSRFRGAVAELAAPARGMSKDDLESEDIRLQRQAVRRRRAAVTALTVLTILAMVATGVALGFADRAAENAERASQEAARANAQARVATSRALAAESASVLPTELDLAMLLSLASNAIEPTVEARDSLYAGLTQRPEVAGYLRGHSAEVVGLAFDSDAKTLATASMDGTVRLWDTATAASIGIARTAEIEGPTPLAFSPDGRRLALGGNDVTVFEVDGDARGMTLGDDQDDQDTVSTLDFSRDGRLLATGGCAGTQDCLAGVVRIWDVQDASERARTRLDSNVTEVAFSRDGGVVAVGTGLGDVLLVDAQTGEVIWQTLRGHPDGIEGLSFSADGRTLVSASGTATPEPLMGDVASPTVRFWRRTTGKQRHQSTSFPISSTGATPVTAALSPDGAHFATVSDDAVVTLWDSRTGDEAGLNLRGHSATIWSSEFDHAGRLLATGDEDGTVILWNLSSSQPTGVRALSDRLSIDAPIAKSVAANSDDTLVAIGSALGLQFWSGEQHAEVGNLSPGPFLGFSRVAFSPDDSIVAAVGVDGPATRTGTLAAGAEVGTLRFYDTSTLRQRGETLVTGRWVEDVAFRPGGELLATANGAGGTRLWDPITGRTTAHFPGDARRLAFSPDGDVLAVGSIDGQVATRGLPSGELGTFFEVPGAVTALSFSPDGRLLAVGTEGREDGDPPGAMVIWDTVRSRQLHRPIVNGLDRGVSALVFSPDGVHVATGAGPDFAQNNPDAPIRLWSVHSGKPILGPLTGHHEAVTDLAAAPHTDSWSVIATDREGAVRWDLDAESWRRRACRFAQRDLSERAWRRIVGTLYPYRSLCTADADSPRTPAPESESAVDDRPSEASTAAQGSGRSAEPRRAEKLIAKHYRPDEGTYVGACPDVVEPWLRVGRWYEGDAVRHCSRALGHVPGGVVYGVGEATIMLLGEKAGRWRVLDEAVDENELERLPTQAS
jgi:WD40 repeat protein